MDISWDKSTEEKYKQLLEKIPVFMRSIAEEKITQKASALVKEDNRNQITEKDLVDAFFAETPFGFHGPMKTDMEALGINYKKYGHQ